MEIIVGKTAGFCAGVFNSYSKTIKLLKDECSLFCLGELVHNSHVVDTLKKAGLKIIDSFDNIDNCKVIVRAHGIPKSTYNLAREKNIELIDLTCPKVLRVHKLAEQLNSEGYFIILIAQKEHPETIGTISFCGENSCIVEDESDVDAIIDIAKDKKIAIISQTTFSVTKFNNLCDYIKNKINNNILVNNTICDATNLRQKETFELSKKVDTMIIIGGKNSSNTKKLYEIAYKFVKTYFVETYDELINCSEELKKLNTIGIMAGASTSKDTINDLIKWLNNL